MTYLREKTVITSLWVGALVMLYVRLERVQKMGLRLRWSPSAWWDADVRTKRAYGMIMSPVADNLGHGWDWQSCDLMREDEWRRHVIFYDLAHIGERNKDRKLRL